MKIYLEAAEQAEGEAESVRLDVTGKEEAEIAGIVVLLKDFMSGLTCTFYRHNCRHDVGGSCDRAEV